MIPKFVYVGSSWAQQSFDPAGFPVTNLAQQWNMPFVDLSMCAASCLDRVQAARRIGAHGAMIWLYPEPLIDLALITGLSHAELMQRNDWNDIRNECDYHCMKEISSLGVPVLMIGAHSDVVDHGLANIEICCASWQKWLARAGGMTTDKDRIFVDSGHYWIDRCWGAEVMHQAIHLHSHIDPDPDLLDQVIDIYLFWKELEKHQLFYQVHPNHRANVLFASEIKPIVVEFLQDKS